MLSVELCIFSKFLHNNLRLSEPAPECWVKSDRVSKVLKILHYTNNIQYLILPNQSLISNNGYFHKLRWKYCLAPLHAMNTAIRLIFLSLSDLRPVSPCLTPPAPVVPALLRLFYIFKLYAVTPYRARQTVQRCWVLILRSQLRHFSEPVSEWEVLRANWIRHRLRVMTQLTSWSLYLR